MPKARKRTYATASRRTPGRGQAVAPTMDTNVLEQSYAVHSRGDGLSSPRKTATVPSRAFVSPRVGGRGPQSLIFPIMVALGCWGIAFSFLFLSTETNHLVFGGMAVLMALIWSLSVGIRIRKFLLLRQKS